MEIIALTALTLPEIKFIFGELFRLLYIPTKTASISNTFLRI